ncbi:MAG: MCE family protein [Planctomycetes bacterium]|nr:MCE family protein [Planctomycetota bacterium]
MDGYPEANIRTPNRTVATVVSRLWILTILCAVVAGGLVAWQLGGRGPVIEVHFAEGYGLQAGDPVRYRGITVGEIVEIDLDETLEAVVVQIQLTEAAAEVAREGARFWIERPNISIGKVRGLDTLMGGRFVGVLPGPIDAPSCRKFYGLEVASAPVRNLTDGLEVTLESKGRYGLQAGSPINYRGVTVGQILSVGLTNDAATVEARAYIEPEYRQLVREQTKFWSSSGLDVKIGFSGIELDADTLATIAAGGVGFATPNSPGKLAATGQRFELHKSPRAEWLDWQPRVAIGNAALPQGLVTPRPVLGIRTQSGALGVLGAGRERGWLLPLAEGRLIGPANVLTGEDGETYRLEVAGQESDLPLAELRQSSLLASGLLQQASAEQMIEAQIALWPTHKIRLANKPEAVVIIGGSADETLPIAAQRLTAQEDGWVVEPSVPIDESWHGACVLSARDGFVIGILLRSDERSLIALLTKELLEPSALDGK